MIGSSVSNGKVMFQPPHSWRESIWLLAVSSILASFWLGSGETFALAEELQPAADISADDEQDTGEVDQQLLELHSRIAWDTLNRGDLVRAEAMFRDILRRDPLRPEEIAGLSAALARQNKLDESISVLSDGVTQFPQNPTLASALGQAYLNTENTRAALDSLNRAFNLDPSMPDLRYFLGSAYLKCEYPLLALDMMCGAETSRREIAWAQSLALGTAFSQLGLQSEASGFFQNVANEGIGIPMAENASQLQKAMDEAFFGREYLRGSLKITERYDTNPGVVPAANIIMLPLVSTPSWGNLYQGEISYDLVRRYNWDVTTGSSFTHTNNYDAHMFDLVDNALYLESVHRNYWRGRPVHSGVRIDYDHLFLGSDDFLNRMIVTPSVSMFHSDWESTTGLLRYSLQEFPGQGAFSGTPFDLDSDNLAVGLLHERQLSGRNLVLSVGYQYDHSFSDGSNFDYNGHKLQLGARWQTPIPELKVLANGDLYFRDYDNPHSIFGFNRDDREYLVQVSLVYQLKQDLDVLLELNFDRNESNIPTNDYARHTLDLGVQYFFPGGRLDRQ